MCTNSFIRKLSYVTPKNIFWNFKILPLKQAIKIPLCFSRYCKVSIPRNGIVIEAPKVKPGMAKFGYSYVGFSKSTIDHSLIVIEKQGIQSGKLFIHGFFYLGAGSRLDIGALGSIHTGNNFKVSCLSRIICTSNISFGENCLISWECLFMDSDFHRLFKNGKVINDSKSIIIGNNVLIGARSTILKGASIPNNTVIGGCSAVTKNLSKQNCVYAGVPAHIIHESIEWKE